MSGLLRPLVVRCAHDTLNRQYAGPRRDPMPRCASAYHSYLGVLCFVVVWFRVSKATHLRAPPAPRFIYASALNDCTKPVVMTAPSEPETSDPKPGTFHPVNP